MKINLIWAQSQDGFIGADGTLMWHIPEDLERFKWLTSACPVIMGRKTWDSLPTHVRPLPGRRNIVLTRRPGAIPGVYQYTENGKSHYKVDTVERALALAENFYESNYGEDVWIIGGAQIYKLFMPLADFLYVTSVYREYPFGDTTAPKIDHYDAWSPVSTEVKKSSNGIIYDNTIYKRA